LLGVLGWPVDNVGALYPVDARYDLAFGRFEDGSLLVRAATRFPTPGAGYKVVLVKESFFYRFLPVKPAGTQTEDH
jgi:hypothetical protein